MDDGIESERIGLMVGGLRIFAFEHKLWPIGIGIGTWPNVAAASGLLAPATLVYFRFFF